MATPCVRSSAVNSRGGVIYTVVNVVLTFNGTSTFINNSATYNRGGAIYTSHNAVLTFNGANNFISNSVLDNGAIYSFRNVVLTFTGSNIATQQTIMVVQSTQQTPSLLSKESTTL